MLLLHFKVSFTKGLSRFPLNAELRRGTLVKAEQRNNHFSRPSSFIRREPVWTLSARRPATVCAAKRETLQAGRMPFQVSAEGTACPASCETPLPVSFLHS